MVEIETLVRKLLSWGSLEAIWQHDHVSYDGTTNLSKGFEKQKHRKVWTQILCKNKNNASTQTSIKCTECQAETSQICNIWSRWTLKDSNQISIFPNKAFVGSLMPGNPIGKVHKLWSWSPLVNFVTKLSPRCIVTSKTHSRSKQYKATEKKICSKTI